MVLAFHEAPPSADEQGDADDRKKSQRVLHGPPLYPVWFTPQDRRGGLIRARRVYNMDETSFLARTKNTKVVALKETQNVWSKSISANFHLSVVACGSASGHVIPPLFILPGQRVPRNLMECCHVAEARVTCTERGLINRANFLKWVEMFLNTVPNSVPRPIFVAY